MKNIRLLNLVCRDTSPPQRSRSKEINLLFWNGYTGHTSLDSSKFLLIEILKISSGLWKLSLQIALVRFPFFKHLLYLQSLQYNHFFLHFHWYWRFIDTLFMVTWSAVTFCQFFAKFESPWWRYIGNPFLQNFFFINGCTFGKSWPFKSFGSVNTNGVGLTYTLKCPGEYLPPTPWMALQGYPLKGMFLMITKARKIACRPGVYSHWFGDTVCFCSRLLPVESALEFCLALTLFENSFVLQIKIGYLPHSSNQIVFIKFLLVCHLFVINMWSVSGTFFLQKYDVVLKLDPITE